MKYFFVSICITFYAFSFAKVDYVRVMFNHNGSNQATVGWSQVSGENPILFIGTKDMNAENYTEKTLQKSPSTANTFKGIQNTFVRLNELKPNTAYYFIIKDSEGISERYWFKTTHNDPAKRLSILGGGDSRTGIKVRQNGFRMAGKLMPDAIMFDGDFTDVDTEPKWREWFDDWSLTYKDYDNKIIPIIAARGNHEYTNKDLVKFFDCPDKKNVYNVTLGGNLLNVICLNTEISISAQVTFLKQTLEQHKNYYWQIPQVHRAIRPHVKWKMKSKIPKLMYALWVPIFEQYGIQVVLECDTHITKTTYPIRKTKKKGHEEGFIRDDENGIVYVGEGCWGAPLRDPDVKREWTKHLGKANSFKWFWIDQDKIEIRTVAFDNVAEVEKLSENDRFRNPKGLNLWPTNNDIEIIYHRDYCPID